jgi:hypothetical protein
MVILKILYRYTHHSKVAFDRSHNFCFANEMRFNFLITIRSTECFAHPLNLKKLIVHSIMNYLVMQRSFVVKRGGARSSSPSSSHLMIAAPGSEAAAEIKSRFRESTLCRRLVPRSERRGLAYATGATRERSGLRRRRSAGARCLSLARSQFWARTEQGYLLLYVLRGKKKIHLLHCFAFLESFNSVASESQIELLRN